MNPVISAICQNILIKLSGFKFIASIVAPRNLNENLLSLLNVLILIVVKGWKQKSQELQFLAFCYLYKAKRPDLIKDHGVLRFVV